METISAKLRYLRIAPRKVRLAAAVLKGRSVNEAEAELVLSPRRSRDYILRLLRSAVANAEHNKKVSSDRLFIKEIYVDQGPKLKRGMPRARGSMALIEKKMSHLTIVLGVLDVAKEKKYSITTDAKKKKVVKPKKESAKKHVDADTHGASDSTSEKKAAKEKKGAGQKVFRRKAI